MSWTKFIALRNSSWGILISDISAYFYLILLILVQLVHLCTETKFREKQWFLGAVRLLTNVFKSKEFLILCGILVIIFLSTLGRYFQRFYKGDWTVEMTSAKSILFFVILAIRIILFLGVVDG